MNKTGCSALWRRFGAAFLVFGVLIAPIDEAAARTPPSSAPDVLTLNEAARLLRIGPEELKGMAAQNKIPARRIGSRWRFNRDALMAWLNGDWTLIITARPPPVTRRTSSRKPEPAPPVPDLSLNAQDMARITAAGTNIAQAKSDQNPEGGKNEKPIGEAPEERTAEDVFLRGQKVLLAPGDVTMDFGQFYSRSDDTTVSSGGNLATLEQETFTTLLLARVGVLDETELFASTTFRDQNSDVFVGGTRTFESDRTEFGDIRVGLRRTLLHEAEGRPNIIATMDGRIPTGHTSYAAGGGLAFVKSIDPVVLFANANYRRTFSREFGNISLLEPENRIDMSMGYALALNDTLTISTSVSGVYTDTTDFDNATLRSQESYSLGFGLTSWLAKGLYVEPSVSFGLSGPGNSVAFGVTVPYKF
jgi:excisionase family DNA binding protein